MSEKDDGSFYKGVLLLVAGLIVMIGCVILYEHDKETAPAACLIAVFVGGGLCVGGATLFGVDVKSWFENDASED